jgi:DNA-binding response OmpR family regulator
MARRYVLVVEDNPDICALLGRMLASYDAEILVSLDVADAVEKSRDFPVHLALVDVILYDDDERGLKIVKALREEGLRSPVYMMTGVPREELPDEILALVDGVLPKPFAYSTLRSVLEKHLGTTSTASRQGTLLRDVLGMMTSVATEQEEIRRQQERLSSFMMRLQTKEVDAQATAPGLDAFRASVERYEQGLERIQNMLEEVQILFKEKTK